MRSAPFLPTLIYLAGLLAVVPFVPADASQLHSSSSGLYHSHLRRLRLQQRDVTLPTGWSAVGCFTWVIARPSQESSAGYVDTKTLTVENCVNFCNNQHFTYAGVEYGQECYCGNALSNGGTAAPNADCSFPCTGNANERCGAGFRLNLYSSTGVTSTPPPGPVIVPSSGPWVSLGCYSDSVAARTLTTATAVRGGAANNSVESCTAACSTSGYTLAGVEYSQECYCSNTVANGGAPTAAGDCSMVCTGNGAEVCGGPNRLNVYSLNGTAGGGGGGPTNPPGSGGWTSLGCYSDNVAARTLTVPTAVQGGAANNSVESCTAACSASGYALAGVEYSQECYCSNTIANGGASTAAGDCSMTCTGNSAEVCGGPNRLNLYSRNGTTGGGGGGGPTNPPGSGGWASLGCYSDNVAARTLTVATAVQGGATNNSVESCTAACSASGYILAGVEYSQECYCGNTFANGGAPTAAGDCNMACTGNSSETCGGPSRLNVYNHTTTVSTPPQTGWSYNACWVDNAHGRILQTELPDNQALTVESCTVSCASQGFTLAGLEYGVQCFCGNNLVQGAVVAPAGDCNMACSGNNNEKCGGPNRVSVYTSTGNVTAIGVPAAQTTNLPGNWQYSRCLAEPGAVRVFPYQIIFPQNNSAQNCLSQCSKFGYPAAGMEYGQECWCGDVADITNNGGTTAPEADCSMPCSGDALHLCGGPQRLQLYLWNGNLNTWNTPANIGRYQYLVPGLVPPLLATLGINGKVSFLEKGGTSEFANSTGAYELDLSLVNDFTHAWREMHVKSDVFCSAAVVLPDKAARILNVGGWALGSTFGIRLYAPDGSPGVTSVNDWEEDPNNFRLQGGRWYPTALVLSNGSVLVMGGETGANAPANPTLEILPRIPGGDTTVFLDWLQRTDPNNLYPFLHVLPSGRIFVGYYNEARILDPVTFATVNVLPNIPGSVMDFLAGRTYPMEGASVLLPQRAPYTDPLTVLVCGGATSNGIALDNCISIQPEAANPTWVIERMPSRRVMPCIVALPDGTFMIVNGAHQGVAGFGLASDPNLSAVLYDPSKPANSRMSILGNTTIARMYHSEATLLPDGRVLISGSDPETKGLPEELRIEVYIPPYLDQGFTQPVVTVPNTDWAYDGQFQINVQLFQGATSGMRVSLVAAVSSTHGNTMGGRTIFPAFTCSGNTCTVTAPPNAQVSPPGWHQLFILDGPTPSHGVFVRIGGDPAELGNWPNLPGFNTPGV